MICLVWLERKILDWGAMQALIDFENVLGGQDSGDSPSGSTTDLSKGTAGKGKADGDGGKDKGGGGEGNGEKKPKKPRRPWPVVKAGAGSAPEVLEVEKKEKGEKKGEEGKSLMGGEVVKSPDVEEGKGL